MSSLVCFLHLFRARDFGMLSLLDCKKNLLIGAWMISFQWLLTDIFIGIFSGSLLRYGRSLQNQSAKYFLKDRFSIPLLNFCCNKRPLIALRRGWLLSGFLHIDDHPKHLSSFECWTTLSIMPLNLILCPGSLTSFVVRALKKDGKGPGFYHSYWANSWISFGSSSLISFSLERKLIIVFCDIVLIIV